MRIWEWSSRDENDDEDGQGEEVKLWYTVETASLLEREFQQLGEETPCVKHLG